jgi:hypothetical protein
MLSMLTDSIKPRSAKMGLEGVVLFCRKKGATLRPKNKNQF